MGRIAAMSIQKNLQLLLDRAGLTPHSLAAEAKKRGLEVNQPTVHRILDGQAKTPRDSTLEPIAAFFGVSVLDLRYSDLSQMTTRSLRSSGTVIPANSPSPYGGDRTDLTQIKAAARLPLISWVGAGMMLDVEDPYPVGDAKEWLDTPFEAGPNAFLLEVSGESMSPEYRDGEVIQVEPSLQARSGDDVIVRTPNGKVTFKRYRESQDGNYLEALNPIWPERIIQVPEGTEIVGVVVGSWMRRRRR